MITVRRPWCPLETWWALEAVTLDLQPWEDHLIISGSVELSRRLLYLLSSPYMPVMVTSNEDTQTFSIHLIGIPESEGNSTRRRFMDSSPVGWLC